MMIQQFFAKINELNKIESIFDIQRLFYSRQVIEKINNRLNKYRNSQIY